MRLRLLLPALLVLIALVVPAAATAQTTATASPADAVQSAADALRNQSVYVAPDNAAGISPADAAEIATAVRNAGGNMVVAVFPPGVGDPEVLARELSDQLRRPAAYAVIAGPA